MQADGSNTTTTLGVRDPLETLRGPSPAPLQTIPRPDHFVTFNDAVADDLFDLLLQHEFQPSPPPPSLSYSPPQNPAMPSPPPTLQNQPTEIICLTDSSSDDDDGANVARPDLAPPPASTAVGPTRSPAAAAAAAAAAPAPAPMHTYESCLAQVLQVLPDIAHDHVLALYNSAQPPSTPTAQSSETWIQNFISDILENGKYPTQREAKQGTKRKREMSEEEAEWRTFEAAGAEEGERLGELYLHYGAELLKDEFPATRYLHIQNVFRRRKSVFKAYADLANDSAQGIERLASRRKTKNQPALPSMASDPPGHLFPPSAQDTTGFQQASKELRAARRKRESLELKQRALDAAALAEHENELLAQREGTLQECGCCCADYPMNRMVICQNAETSSPHWLCYACVKKHVETEIGQSRHRIVCFHVEGCAFGFAREQLGRCVPVRQLEKLERLQQEEEIRCAGLEGLEDCPFCDFKAICPPKDVDREFRCGNDECAIVSCRLCNQETHIPLSCAEKAKEKGIDARHAVEEAMTAALIRTCNKCKKTFIKDSGCNKMSCTGCGNLQCYVCGKDVKDYRHFGGNGGNGSCPLHDNTDKRHQTEVEKAEKEALKKAREENPDVDEDALRIKVSEEVKRLEEENIRDQNELYGFVGGAPPPLHHGRRRAGVHIANDAERRDYELQLYLLERQNRRRLMLVRAAEQAPNPLAGVLEAGRQGQQEHQVRRGARQEQQRPQMLDRAAQHPPNPPAGVQGAGGHNQQGHQAQLAVQHQAHQRHLGLAENQHHPPGAPMMMHAPLPPPQLDQHGQYAYPPPGIAVHAGMLPPWHAHPNAMIQPGIPPAHNQNLAPPDLARQMQLQQRQQAQLQAQMQAMAAQAALRGPIAPAAFGAQQMMPQYQVFAINPVPNAMLVPLHPPMPAMPFRRQAPRVQQQQQQQPVAAQTPSRGDRRRSRAGGGGVE